MSSVHGLPGDIRVRLDGESERRLWQEVDKAGGIQVFCRENGFSESRVYNWKNHTDFYPVRFVMELLENPGVEALKGGGRSLPIENPVLPLPEDDELLTRASCSVSVNGDGVPVYRAAGQSLVERFRDLLSRLGEVPVSVYSRPSGYELRYPAYLQYIFETMEFEPHFPTLIDEEGRVEDGKLVARGRSIDVDEFDGRLYSDEKRLELALQRGDSETVSELIGAEARKVRELFG
ncbi:MAG: hypothetical protein ABEJ91_03310 [Candidatus Nanohaloarchaea archaeon]